MQQRNFDLGAALSDGFSTWTSNIVRFAIAAAMVFVPLALVRAVLDFVPFVGFAAGSAITSIGGVVLTAMIVSAITRERSGSAELTPGEMLDAVKPHLASLAVVGVLVGVASLFCLLPGIVLGFIGILAPALIVLEGAEPIDSFKLSLERMKGNELMVLVLALIIGFATFATLMVAGIVLAIIFVAVLNLPTFLFVMIPTLIVGVVIAPVTSSMVAEAYFQLSDPGAGSDGGNTQPPAMPQPENPQGPFA